MSILAAAAGATIAGVAASGLIVKYTQKDYELRIEELKGLLAKLNVHETRLVELKSQLSSAWADEAAALTAQNLEKELQRVRDYHMWVLI